MINRIVPMASPFSLYVRRREPLWMLKKIALAALAAVYHQPSQAMVALKPDVVERVRCLDGIMLEGGRRWKPITGEQKAP